MENYDNYIASLLLNYRCLKSLIIFVKPEIEKFKENNNKVMTDVTIERLENYKWWLIWVEEEINKLEKITGKHISTNY